MHGVGQQRFAVRQPSDDSFQQRQADIPDNTDPSRKLCFTKTLVIHQA
jgi:hypothetical protein